MTQRLVAEPPSGTRASAQPMADGPKHAGRHPGVILMVIATCQLMLILDGTIVNIALPDIQEHLHFSSAGLSWVINIYTLAFGGLLLLGGRAGDILGRRRMFITGLIVFTLASLTGGFATSSSWLLAARALQGIGAAMAGPSALSLIMANFEEGPARTRAIGVFSSVSAAGASVGLIAGGLILSWASWRWVMFVNVPIGAAAVFLAPRILSETEKHPSRFDLGGAFTATTGLVSLVYGFIRASEDGWGNQWTIGSFAVALVLLGLFVAIELRVSQPIAPLHLFANRNRGGAYLNMLLVPATMFGMFFFITQFVQDALGFSPIKAGVAFLPMTIVLFITARTASRFIPRYGSKPFLIIGSTLVLIGTLWISRITESSSYAANFLGPMIIFGLGAGQYFVSLNVLILSGVERKDSGAASGLLQTMQQIGGALGLSILVTVFESSSKNEAKHPPANLTGELLDRHLFATGASDAFLMGAAFAVVALIVTVFVIRSPKRTAPIQTQAVEPVISH
jgi:EmrB/QacA subfamily drug resistance transporter